MTGGPPPSTPPETFDSGGTTLPRVLHLPGGPGPHPIVVLLNGFPGHERNTDLAQALRRAGYATLVFHYRGSWGVPGSWSWSWGNVLDDATRVVDAVRAPAFTATHRMDPHRLAVVGHSLGGFAALMPAAADPSIAAVTSVAGFGFGPVALACRHDDNLRAEYTATFDAELLPLRGTSGTALVAEMMAASETWSLARLAPKLAPRPVLLVDTGRDPVTPAVAHHQPLVAAYTAQPIDALEHRLFHTDHALSDHRVALTHTVRRFLDRYLGTPR